MDLFRFRSESARHGVHAGVRTSLSILTMLCLPILGAVAAAGQTTPATGQILGQVVDGASGTPLPGAQILINDGPQGTVAGVEGRFQLRNVPAGRVRLQVLLIGFAPFTLEDVIVEAGGLARVELRLTRQAIAVAGITVQTEADRGSSATLLSEQQRASGVVNAISAEQISRSPDGDAAAAVRRVSGVSVQDGKYVFVRGLGERYTTSSLNGTRIPSPEPERKIVPLDLFPAGLLQAISTSKTFTPDQPGDFAGASVDIRTPSFPNRTTWSLSLSTGWADGSTGALLPRAPRGSGEWFARATEPRTIPFEAANYSGVASRGDEVNGVVNSFRNVWSVTEARGLPPMSVGGSVGGSAPILGQTFGYLGSLTYSASEEAKRDEYRARVGTGNVPIDDFTGESGTHSVLWGGILNVAMLLGNHSQIHLNNSYNRSADNTARSEQGVDENTRSTVRVERLTYVERYVRSHQLRGEHQAGSRHRLDWSLSTSAVERAEPDRSEFVTWMDPTPPVWFNDFEGAVRTFGSLTETALEGSAQYAFSFRLGGGDLSELKAGVRWRTTDREAASQGFRIQAFDWAPGDPRWQAPPEEFFDGRNARPGDRSFLLSRELAGGGYLADDELTAGFLMADVALLPRLRLIGGVRQEQYTLNVTSENQVGQVSVTERDYTDLLPALSAVVSLTDRQQLRFAASRTLARPEFRELAPITYREVLGGDQVIGNQNLERTLIRNVDLRWEWYPRPGEVFSVGVFRKDFDAPVEERYLARSGTDTRTFENAASAVNEGVEIEFSTGLGRLTPSLENLSAFANVTLMRSEVDTGNPSDEPRALVGQAPYVLNGGMTWSPVAEGWTATLLYNVVGPRIRNARASGVTVEDVKEESRHLLDLSVRFPVRGGLSGKVDLKNLLDSPYELRQGPVLRASWRTGRSVSAGISWRW